MRKVLSERETHNLMMSLTDQQRNFISEYIVQSKKSKWLESLERSNKSFNHKENTSTVKKENTKEWILTNILDGGFGKRPFKCECGNSLRHQYIVYNNTENKEYKFGGTCFEEHTNLSSEVVKNIKNGFYHIDLEVDEILIKIKNKDFFDISPFLYLKEDLTLEPLIQQAKLQLPLSNKQIDKLRRSEIVYKHNKEKKEVYHSLSELQITLIEKLPLKEQIEIINSILKKQLYYEELPDNVESLEIQLFVKLGLPLLKKHRIRFSSPEYLAAQQINTRYNQEDTKQGPGATEREIVTYETFMERYIHILRAIRKNENRINTLLQNDWIIVQDSIKNFKDGKEFDYDSFKVVLEKILKQLDLNEEDMIS